MTSTLTVKSSRIHVWKNIGKFNPLGLFKFISSV